MRSVKYLRHILAQIFQTFFIPSHFAGKFNLHGTCHFNHPPLVIRKMLNKILPSTSEVWLFVYIETHVGISIDNSGVIMGNMCHCYTWKCKILYILVLLLQQI